MTEKVASVRLKGFWHIPFYIELDRKARFARDRAARGWRVAYQATPMDLTNQSHTLDPALKASRARRIAPIRLLKKDSISYSLPHLMLEV